MSFRAQRLVRFLRPLTRTAPHLPPSSREGLAAKWLAQTPVSAYRNATYGHGEIVLHNATTIEWQWHENPDAESNVADNIFITKGVDV